jgi:hypothetical protein
MSVVVFITDGEEEEFYFMETEEEEKLESSDVRNYEQYKPASISLSKLLYL